jgi:hypothetical protein
LPRKLSFTDPEKIPELARQGLAWGDSESRQPIYFNQLSEEFPHAQFGSVEGAAPTSRDSIDAT